MKASVGSLEDVAAAAEQPTAYYGRFVRKQGQFGSVAVVGRVNGSMAELIADPKRLFAKNGTVETHGVAQHAGLSPGDWVEFDVARNTRPRAAEYRVKHLRRIPRYAVLTKGGEAFYRTLLTREGWRGDRRPGLWALRIAVDRVVIADLELGKDGALRLSRAAARAVAFHPYRDDAVVRLGDASKSEEAYLDLDGSASGVFDWSDEADHVARVIRSLSDANDPRVSDIIAWLELHQEAGTGKVFAATLDHDAALDAVRSGELADRLRADRELMKVYLDAALGDESVALAVAEYARQGNTAGRERLLAALEDEVAERRAGLVADQDAKLAQMRADAMAAVDTDIAALRASRVAEVEGLAMRDVADHRSLMADMEGERGQRQAEIDQELEVARLQLSELKGQIENSQDELLSTRGQLESDNERIRAATAEVDRLLSISERMTPALGTVDPAPARTSHVPYSFPDRETVSIRAVGESIEGLALLSAKGRGLMRQLLILMLAGEMPLAYGTDALDFVKLAGIIATPGRTGLMRADPTCVSIEDLWARPGSGAPTMLAAAAAASSGGTAVLMGIVGVERSGARIWVPALGEAIRSGTLPRALLVCGVVEDIEHDEVKALPRDAVLLEIEGVFEAGAFFGALALPTVATSQQFAVEPGPVPSEVGAATRILATLGFEPTLGLAVRLARITAEAVSMLGENGSTTGLIVELAQNINSHDR